MGVQGIGSTSAETPLATQKGSAARRIRRRRDLGALPGRCLPSHNARADDATPGRTPPCSTSMWLTCSPPQMHRPSPPQVDCPAYVKVKVQSRPDMSLTVSLASTGHTDGILYHFLHFDPAKKANQCFNRSTVSFGRHM